MIPGTLVQRVAAADDRPVEAVGAAVGDRRAVPMVLPARRRH